MYVLEVNPNPDGGYIRTRYWDKWLGITNSQLIDSGKIRYKEDALVSDRNTKDVGGQIFECRLPRAGRLTMNDPILFPDLWIDEVK